MKNYNSRIIYESKFRQPTKIWNGFRTILGHKLLRVSFIPTSRFPVKRLAVLFHISSTLKAIRLPSLPLPLTLNRS